MFLFYATVVFAGIVNIVCYSLVCRKLGSWINCFTMLYGQSFFIDIFLGYTGLGFFGIRSSLWAFAFCYATYMASAIAVAAVVLFAKPPELKWFPTTAALHIGRIPWILLTLAFLIYLPVLIQFRASILSPRDIYIQTRIGYGQFFFVSSFFCYLAFILYLFKRARTRLGLTIMFFLSTLLLLLHGSKGEALFIFIFFLVFQVHGQRKRYGVGRSAASGGLIVLLLAGAFFLFGNLQNASDLLNYMTAYSDYTYNATRLIDAPPPQYPYLGKIMIEEALYTRIPRFLYPNKPHIYGAIRLSDYYDPIGTSLEQGAVAFGPGVRYADFGPLALIILPIESAISAYLAIGFMKRLRFNPTPGSFLLLLYLCGLSVIPLSAFTLFPEMLLMAVLIDKALSRRWSIKFA